MVCNAWQIKCLFYTCPCYFTPAIFYELSLAEDASLIVASSFVYHMVNALFIVDVFLLHVPLYSLGNFRLISNHYLLQVKIFSFSVFLSQCSFHFFSSGGWRPLYSYMQRCMQNTYDLFNISISSITHPSMLSINNKSLCSTPSFCMYFVFVRTSLFRLEIPI